MDKLVKALYYPFNIFEIIFVFTTLKHIIVPNVTKKTNMSVTPKNLFLLILPCNIILLKLHLNRLIATLCCIKL